MNTKVAVPKYKNLVSDIVFLVDRARKVLVETYWTIGRRIVEIEQDGQVRAVYGAHLLQNLSKELTQKLGSGFSERSLGRMRAFYLENPISSPATKLTWAHHIELLAVDDPKRRLMLEKRAEKKGLDRNELREIIRAQGERINQAREPISATRPISASPLLPKRGVLGLYQVVSAETTGAEEEEALFLDHGFRFYRRLEPQASKELKAGDIVEIRGKKIVKVSDAVKPGHTYHARLQKVIDGDTYWVVLDLGLDSLARFKLRLRGIDCPEIQTPEGRAAKRFVESLLGSASMLTVCSFKNDKYDRYEADVFFENAAGEEIFINQHLLDAGHAVRMTH